MSGSVFTTMNESFQKSSIGREKAAIGQGFTMMRTEIAPYRSSEHFGFTPKREMIPNAASESFIMSTKYKNGSKDDAILMGKWLSFHDRKWLTFKRPLTPFEKKPVSRQQFQAFEIQGHNLIEIELAHKVAEGRNQHRYGG